MATASSVAPVRDTPLQETTGDKTDNGVVVPAHPAWLRALWHYDPGYDYDLEHHEYDEFLTTDPYYIELEVRLSSLPEHSVFLDRAGRNLETFLDLRERHGPITREVMILDLEALPAHPGLTRSRHRIVPDLALWPAGTVIAPDRVVSWREQGAPLLVLECLSPSTEPKDREDNPVIYDLMGVAEYWICSPSDRHPMFGYQRTDAGEWITVEAGANREAWSLVLQTRIRTDPVHGFQCQDPAGGNWVEMSRHLEAKGMEIGRAEGVEIGRAEGMEIGKAEGKREVLLDLARSLHPTPAEYQAFVRELDQTPWTEWPDIATVLQRFQR
jgi:hypothetical protein